MCETSLFLVFLLWPRHITAALADEVIVHFYMLCACVEHRVPSQMNIAHVVAVKGNQILDGNAQILQYPLELYGFICCHRRAPVFGLCARKSDGWLLLATPGDGSTSEGEDKTRSSSSIGFVASPVGICVPFELNWCGRHIENVIVHRSTHVL